ncbi:MAG: class I SAM-dependent methyltransferase [Roseovarius sp.]|nr:class I SAM-dependent methyltransferase [Roseovarius sp.]
MSDAGSRIAAILAEIGAREVLDIGCGAGGLARVLAERGHAVAGIDPAQEVIAAARERVPDARFSVGGAEALPFGDGSFDACIFLNSLHHVPVPLMQTALHEALRVLRPGGEVVIVEPLARGAFFEVMRPVEDESDIRSAAIAAIDAVLGAGAATGPAPVTWERPTPVADVEAFITYLARVDPARRAVAEAKREEITRLFARHARQSADGPVLDQPLRLWRLQPV